MKKIAVAFLALTLAGCSQTYPANRVKESIQEICRKEYGIENIQVKISGGTIGVFLPMKKLFATDFKEALLSKKAGNLAEVENFFQPAPEALDKVEDVLFSISRVLLSTDRKLQFYSLQATDVEKSGLDLVLTGYVDDIKRVRLWDISRDEYRKRILHELKLNRAVVWHRPVRAFFQALEESPSLKTAQEHLLGPVTPEVFQSLFFFNPLTPGNKSAQWKLGELRSAPFQTTQVLIYAPVTVKYDSRRTAAVRAFQVPSGASVDYLFIVSFASEVPEILRVIPLSYVDEAGNLQKVTLPQELSLDKDLKSWETEFPLSEIHLGDFLAEQLTRRTQNLLYSDERIRNTFEKLQLAFRYQKDPSKPRNFFSFELDVTPRTPAAFVARTSAHDEDVLYLLNLASREFVNLLRSYKFSDYEFLRLNVASDPVAHILGREDLELFRRNKADLAGLLGPVSPF